MFDRSPGPLRAGVLAATLAATVGISLPSPASAATTAFGCEASAIRGAVLGGAPFEPVVANRGALSCRSTEAGLEMPLAGVLSAAVGSARTSYTDADGRQTALAGGGLAELRVLSLPQLPITLPTAQISDTLGSVAVPISEPLRTLLGGLEGIEIDLRPAHQALLPDRQLPLAELVRVQGAMAYAGATCDAHRPQLDGSSSVTALTILGQQAVGQAVDRVLTLIDTGSIDPSDVDLSNIVLPLGLDFGTPVTGPLLEEAVRAAIDALAPIEIPATLAQVKVTPGTQLRTADALLQQALRVQVAIAGQALVDVVAGEAIVRASGTCLTEAEAGQIAAEAGRIAATEAVLGCTKSRLVLTDVQERSGRVRLLGVADRSLAGQRLQIRFTHSGKTVAYATVRDDGSFTTTARLPPKRLRSTNDARYQALLGTERSLKLKLTRRMVLSGTRSANGKVTLSGRVVRPLGRPIGQITVSRRVSCERNEVVARIKPGSDGRFRVTVDAPDGELAAVYRLTTRVRKSTRSRKTFQSFTLPRAISLS
ncbi:MAG: hypothetical protein KY463_14545 [Actinobacteria bacterium]|nr:hypothetical protein [Actinomycetota bacterium]